MQLNISLKSCYDLIMQRQKRTYEYIFLTYDVNDKKRLIFGLTLQQETSGNWERSKLASYFHATVLPRIHSDFLGPQ